MSPETPGPSEGGSPEPAKASRGVVNKGKASKSVVYKGGRPRKSVKAKNSNIIAVSGTTGGCGKSIVAVNLAATLSAMGHTVILADLARGTRRIHAMLGMEPPALTLEDHIAGKAKDLAKVVVPTPFGGVMLADGGAEYPMGPDKRIK
ncbi:MAG: P-loop NTPase, partial [Nitrospinota bacterium]|nr:P-loop NTPase [Nitrospinota bacterium]